MIAMTESIRLHWTKYSLTTKTILVPPTTCGMKKNRNTKKKRSSIIADQNCADNSFKNILNETMSFQSLRAVYTFVARWWWHTQLLWTVDWISRRTAIAWRDHYGRYSLAERRETRQNKVRFPQRQRSSLSIRSICDRFGGIFDRLVQ